MYLDNFSNKQDVANEFQIDISTIEDCQILFAAYKTPDYEGSALVIYSKNGKLYEVNGSHCSCYGLEGQWNPEETFMEALRLRDLNYYGFEKNLEELFIDLVFEKEVLENVGE